MIGVTIYLTRVRKHKPQDDYINGVRFGKPVINPFRIRELKQQAKKFCDRVNGWEEIKAWQEYETRTS